jgi:hypothetical protein
MKLEESEIRRGWAQSWDSNYPGPETSKSAHQTGFNAGAHFGYAKAIEQASEGFEEWYKTDCHKSMNGRDAWTAAKLSSAKEIERLEQVNDMQAAMIEGMRRIVALARLSPDIRIQQAFRDYDKCKIMTASGVGNGSLKSNGPITSEG